MNVKAFMVKNRSMVIFVAVMTLIKIVLSGLFSSDYQNELFMPFVGEFTSGTLNPYDVFYSKGITDAFPYPPIMLFIMSIGGVLSKYLSFDVLFLRNVLFKLPLIAFDIVTLVFLLKLFPKQRKLLTLVYYSSPVVIYSVCMHGQLDIIPVGLLTISMYFLFGKKKYNDILFVLFFTLSVMSKQSMLAIAPLVFYYCQRRKRTVRTVFSVFLFLALCAGIMAPFMGEAFINTVLMNKVQNSAMNVFFSYGDVRLYLAVFTIAAIYIHIFTIARIGRDLTFSFCGIIFAVFLIFVSPMPGWFVWIVPFTAAIFVGQKHKKSKLAVYYFMNTMYIIFFVFFHKSEYVDLYFLNESCDFLKADSSTLTNIVFTVLAAALLFVIFTIYEYGINGNTMYRRRKIPFTIGISGDSGTGKSSLNGILSSALGEKNILLIEGDGDHKWERGEKHWEKYTHLNPKANFLYRQARDIATLRNGENVERVDYDHETGTFTPSRIIKPERFIVISGLHSLYLPQMRKNLDLKIFLDTDDKLRVFWKCRRDTGKRGYSLEGIKKQIEKRRDDFIKYILPQRDHANLIIEYYDSSLEENVFDPEHRECISMKLTLSSDINIEPLLTILEKYRIKAEYDFCSDPDMQTIIVDGATMSEDMEIPFVQIAESLIPNFDELYGSFTPCDKVHNSVLQIIILMVINKITESGS